MSIFWTKALILFALQITLTVGKKKLNCLSSYSLDTSITGESPSAAPTETSSPSCPPCVDNKIWRYASVDNQGCEWIALGRENNRDRCTLPLAKTRCPATCGQCKPEEPPGGGDEGSARPSGSPTRNCRNLDDYCEPILMNGEVIPLCTYLETISDKARDDMCLKRNYRSLKQKEGACKYLQSYYPKAYNTQCDQSGRYKGTMHKNTGAASITISYSEICGKTCGVC
mmetsp:Transcript_40881/g.79992  ORF Transcript_40881/g.79992 Transcript_40881/m.79992 type:complete len:227 (+) Transcript_40881:110-790(+)